MAVAVVFFPSLPSLLQLFHSPLLLVAVAGLLEVVVFLLPSSQSLQAELVLLVFVTGLVLEALFQSSQLTLGVGIPEFVSFKLRAY